MFLNLKYGDYVVIIYAMLQTFGILSSSFYVLLKSSASGFRGKFKEIWSYKWIYVSTLSTIYDQATDIGVLIYWYNLRNNDQVFHVDCLSLFVLSCSFCASTRIFNMIWGIIYCQSKFFGLLLGMFDLLVSAFVWGKITNTSLVVFKNSAFKNNEDELSNVTRSQFLEVLLESLPQILLQSLFLIRTFDSTFIYDNKNIFLVWISLFFSVFSATNKISNFAMTGAGNINKRNEFENKYNIRCNGKCPIINIGVLSVKMFYTFNVMTRLFVYCVVWSVVGGIFVIIFFIIVFIIFILGVKCGIYEQDEYNVFGSNQSFMDICIAFIGGEAFCFGALEFYKSLSSGETKRFFIHNLLNYISLFVVLYFSIDDSFDCFYNICADSQIRNIFYNKFLFALIISIFCTSVIQIVLFIKVNSFKMISKKWEGDYRMRKENKSQNIKNEQTTKTRQQECTKKPSKAVKIMMEISQPETHNKKPIEIIQ